MDRIEERTVSKHAVTGVATGYFELDEYMGGLQPGQLIVLAARPSMGKTALALNFADNVGVNLKVPVLVVSLEMGSARTRRATPLRGALVDGKKLRTGQGLGTREMSMLGKGYGEMPPPPPCSSTTPSSRNMLQVTANARRLKMRARSRPDRRRLHPACG